MNRDLWDGKLVRLVAQDPEKDVATKASWDKDTDFTRLLSFEPVTPPNAKEFRERLERPLNGRFYPFSVRTLEDDKLIGFVVVMHVSHVHGDAWVGIGMGEREYRGKGYGTDAMKLALRFAFQELNMHRVSLDALADNLRAVRSYEKCGFKAEGYMRHADFRDGRRSDLITMGVLRRDWEALQAESM